MLLKLTVDTLLVGIWSLLKYCCQHFLWFLLVFLLTLKKTWSCTLLNFKKTYIFCSVPFSYCLFCVIIEIMNKQAQTISWPHTITLFSKQDSEPGAENREGRLTGACLIVCEESKQDVGPNISANRMASALEAVFCKRSKCFLPVWAGVLFSVR